jgi:ribokinase
MSEVEVVVVGSLNMDLVVRAPRLPVPGETLLGRSFSTVPGGKGANQAVAAARLGARTAMIGCVGDDAFGRQLRAGLEADGIDCRALRTLSGQSSGVALIVVEESGRNGIVVVPGANGQLAPEDVDRHPAILAGTRVVALQLEIPLATVEHAARAARAQGKIVVLNPAPAQGLPPDLIACADFLVPNEVEAAMLTGVAVDSVQGAIAAARRLRAQGARNVIITLGERGAVVATATGEQHYLASRVEAVDTTGAGDAFIGGFCAALAKGRTVAEAVAFAQAAAAISVTRHGAQTSMPFEREVSGGTG